jgi:3-isopropylmalate dehydratase small subunit
MIENTHCPPEKIIFYANARNNRFLRVTLSKYAYNQRLQSTLTINAYNQRLQSTLTINAYNQRLHMCVSYYT